jgi:hypothetical protein
VSERSDGDLEYLQAPTTSGEKRTTPTPFELIAMVADLRARLWSYQEQSKIRVVLTKAELEALKAHFNIIGEAKLIRLMGFTVIEEN